MDGQNREVSSRDTRLRAASHESSPSGPQVENSDEEDALDVDGLTASQRLLNIHMAKVGELSIAQIQEYIKDCPADVLTEVLCAGALKSDSVFSCIDQYAFFDPTKRRVFVRGLSYDVDESRLRRAFEPLGAVDDSTIIYDKVHRGRSKGYGFITFGNSVQAAEAVDKGYHMVDGKEAQISWASTLHNPATKARLYAKALHESVDDYKQRMSALRRDDDADANDEDDDNDEVTRSFKQKSGGRQRGGRRRGGTRARDNNRDRDSGDKHQLGAGGRRRRGVRGGRGRDRDRDRDRERERDTRDQRELDREERERDSRRVPMGGAYYRERAPAERYATVLDEYGYEYRRPVTVVERVYADDRELERERRLPPPSTRVAARDYPYTTTTAPYYEDRRRPAPAPPSRTTRAPLAERRRVTHDAYYDTRYETVPVATSRRREAAAVTHSRAPVYERYESRVPEQRTSAAVGVASTVPRYDHTGAVTGHVSAAATSAPHEYDYSRGTYYARPPPPPPRGSVSSAPRPAERVHMYGSEPQPAARRRIVMEPSSERPSEMVTTTSARDLSQVPAAMRYPTTAQPSVVGGDSGARRFEYGGNEEYDPFNATATSGAPNAADYSRRPAHDARPHYASTVSMAAAVGAPAHAPTAAAPTAASYAHSGAGHYYAEQSQPQRNQYDPRTAASQTQSQSATTYYTTSRGY